MGCLHLNAHQINNSLELQNLNVSSNSTDHAVRRCEDKGTTSSADAAQDA